MIYDECIWEEAADACAMMASSDSGGMPGTPAIDIADAVESGSSQQIACQAYLATPRGGMISAGIAGLREVWAEAEARLRCGWTPGDDE